jgi:membrane-associated phospholipid phosphatase
MQGPQMMRRYWISIAVLAGAPVAFALLSILVFVGGLDSWDVRLLSAAGHLRAAPLDWLMLRVTDLGAWFVLAPLTVPLEHVTSAAYPSGHATVSCAFALALCIVFWRARSRSAVAAIAAANVLAVGFSRVYLGVHCPSDVLAGWLVAAAWAAAVDLAISVFRVRGRTSVGGVRDKR